MHRCIFHGKQTRLPVQRKGQAQQEKDRNEQHRIADLARQNRVRQRTDDLAYPVENLTAQVRGKDADDGHAKRLMQQKNQPQRQRQVDDQRIQPLDRVDAEQEPGRDLNEQQQNAEQRDRPPLPPAVSVRCLS